MTKLNSSQAALADGLLNAGCIKFGNFTLKSGLSSPIYIDLRRIISFPKLLVQIGEAYLPLLGNLTFDRLAGLPYAAIPIATAVRTSNSVSRASRSSGSKACELGIFSHKCRARCVRTLADES